MKKKPSKFTLTELDLIREAGSSKHRLSLILKGNNPIGKKSRKGLVFVKDLLNYQLTNISQTTTPKIRYPRKLNWEKNSSITKLISLNSKTLDFDNRRYELKHCLSEYKAKNSKQSIMLPIAEPSIKSVRFTLKKFKSSKKMNVLRDGEKLTIPVLKHKKTKSLDNEIITGSHAPLIYKKSSKQSSLGNDSFLDNYRLKYKARRDLIEKPTNFFFATKKKKNEEISTRIKEWSHFGYESITSQFPLMLS